MHDRVTCVSTSVVLALLLDGVEVVIASTVAVAVASFPAIADNLAMMCSNVDVRSSVLLSLMPTTVSIVMIVATVVSSCQSTHVRLAYPIFVIKGWSSGWTV
jgi:hypothetical protein